MKLFAGVRSLPDINRIVVAGRFLVTSQTDLAAGRCAVVRACSAETDRDGELM